MQILRKLRPTHSIILCIAGLLLLLWVARFPHSEPGTVKRLEAVALGTLGWLAVVGGWSALTASVAKQRGWLPSTCSLVAFWPMCGVAGLFMVLGTNFSMEADFFLCGGWGAGFWAPRLAYPKSELLKTNELTILKLNS